ncbi:MAG TPA: pitrilysin family protein [Gemmatimonadaceae bacterium]|jgi:predicted Zn-dependent peptidase|nr:pitrilysin family protein [Gemmatimonadaceae bacterium]
MRRLLIFAALAIAPADATLGQLPATPPPGGTPKDFRLPEQREFTLPNGMDVTLVPFGTVPKATVSLAIRVGNVNEGPNEVWLADVMGDLMNEGTKSRTAAQIAELTAGMGGGIGVGVGPDQTTIGGSVLSERTADFIRLVADVAQNPRFPESELPRITAARIRQVAIARSQPQPLAREKFHEILYGDHALGRLYPSEAMLKGYTVEQIRAFHAKNFGAARAHLYVAGVYDAAAVEKAIRDAFSGWAKGPEPVTNVPKAKSGRRVELIDRPNAVQSTLVIGLPVPDPSHTDYTALTVADALLGGAFGSRITTNIREQKGYTYSPFSTITTHYGDAYWAEFADVTTNVTGASLKEIFGEIERLRKEPPPANELRGIQNNMAGIFTLQNASRGGVVSQLQFVDLHGLPNTYLTEYVKRVMAVSPAEVQRMVRTHLRPENMAIVVVGDKKTVEEQVKPYTSPVP